MASTKAFTQAIGDPCLSCHRVGRDRGVLSADEEATLVRALADVPGQDDVRSSWNFRRSASLLVDRAVRAMRYSSVAVTIHLLALEGAQA